MTWHLIKGNYPPEYEKVILLDTESKQVVVGEWSDTYGYLWDLAYSEFIEANQNFIPTHWTDL